MGELGPAPVACARLNIGHGDPVDQVTKIKFVTAYTDKESCQTRVRQVFYMLKDDVPNHVNPMINAQMQTSSMACKRLRRLRNARKDGGSSTTSGWSRSCCQRRTDAGGADLDMRLFCTFIESSSPFPVFPLR